MMSRSGCSRAPMPGNHRVDELAGQVLVILVDDRAARARAVAGLADHRPELQLSSGLTRAFDQTSTPASSRISGERSSMSFAGPKTSCACFSLPAPL